MESENRNERKRGKIPWETRNASDSRGLELSRIGSRSHHQADNLFDGLSLVELVEASEFLGTTHDPQPDDPVNWY